MSSAEQEQRRWRLYIDDMIEFSEKVQTYTDGMNQTDFLADSWTYDATLRNIELIGEAATHIPTSVREAHPQIPWRIIIGARNRIIHGYLGIDAKPKKMFLLETDLLAAIRGDDFSLGDLVRGGAFVLPLLGKNRHIYGKIVNRKDTGRPFDRHQHAPELRRKRTLGGHGGPPLHKKTPIRK